MKLLKKKNRTIEIKNKIKKLKQELKKEKIKEKKQKKTLKSEIDKSIIKKQIIIVIFNEIVGALICLLILFILSGRKNYFKLYKELSKLIDTYDAITEDYYGDVDKEKIVNDAISAMVSNVDDVFTNYADEKTTEEFMENVNGTYEGIGATVATEKDGSIKVIDIFKGSSAEKAGLKKNDKILKVDGKDYKGKSSIDIANYIRNAGKKEIKLTIERDGKQKKITLTRKKVEIPTVTSKTIEKEGELVGYIAISTFTPVTTKQFKSNLKNIEKEKISGLIIDVRGNNGGYLSTVTDISSMFLKKGQIIYQLSDKSGTTKIKDKTSEKRTYPIAVLINGSSASASEILASAIKESYNGYVVGTNSYGKGTVQKAKTLSDGSMIKYTIQKWLTPKGIWINKKGVTPTNKIEYEVSKEKDNQLDEAVKLIIEDLEK